MRYATPTLHLAATLVAITIAVGADSPTLGARPADAWDWPIAIGVDSASEVYVGRLTDEGSGNVMRLTADGQPRGAWRTDGPMVDLAVGPDASVYTVMNKSNRVYRFAQGGAPNGMWQADGNVQAIAAGPLGPAIGGSVYVLWTPQRIGEPPSGPPRITRFDPRGAELAGWEVGPLAYDLTVTVTEAAPDGVVTVAEGGGTISRFEPDGSVLGAWRTVAAEGRRIAAGPGGDAYLAFQPSPGEAAELWRYTQDGAGSLACTLPANPPRDVSVDPLSGDIYVLFPDSVLRLAPDCTVLGRISHEQLIGAPPSGSARTLFVPYSAHGIETRF